MSNDSNRDGSSVEPANVGRNVRRSSEAVRFLNDLDHRHGSFRRNASHLSPDEFVQHDVADNKDGFPGKGIEDLFGASLIHGFDFESAYGSNSATAAFTCSTVTDSIQSGDAATRQR